MVPIEIDAIYLVTKIQKKIATVNNNTNTKLLNYMMLDLLLYNVYIDPIIY